MLSTNELDFFHLSCRPGVIVPRGPKRLHCALQHEHPGGHVAYLHQQEHAAGEGQAWWLIWDAQARDWAQLAHCPAYRGARSGFDLCQLPASHHGTHSWLLTPFHDVRT